MSTDSPTRIAILGAGSIGLEAALYARYLGYEVDLYERGQVAEHVRHWGHVRMFSPFRMNRSPLGLSALRAQDTTWQPPADEALLTGGEYAERYLLPLAASDLLADNIRTGVEVIAVGRAGLLKGELCGDEARGEQPFRLLLRERGRHETTAEADIVIDTTGVYGCHNWLGQGGLPALGEMAAEPHLEYGVPDVLDREREAYAGRHTLVIGAGLSAATTVTALAELGHQVPDTWVTWITRAAPAGTGEGAGPVAVVDDDPLPERRRVALAANRLTGGAADHVEYRPGTLLETVAWHADLQRFVVRLSDQPEVDLEVEKIVANVGYRPNLRLFRELHVDTCGVTEAPAKMAAAMKGIDDCLVPPVVDGDTLLNREPRFYILGAKSYGRSPHFLIAHGLEQIRRLFAILGERADLNVYATMT